MSISDANVGDLAHVGHRQSFIPDLQTSFPVFRAAQDVSARCTANPQTEMDPMDTQCSFHSPGTVRASGNFARHSLELLSAALRNGLRSLVPRSSKKVIDSEAQLRNQNLDVLADNECTPLLDLPAIPTSDLEAPSIKWLLETSTAPEVVLAAASLVPQVEWPLDLDVSEMLNQLYGIFRSCVDIHEEIVPSLEEKASAYPYHGEFFGRARRDSDMFLQMILTLVGRRTADLTVLATTMNFCASADRGSGFRWTTFWLDECPYSVLEWMSHSLPYHFVTGRVNEDVEEFAIEVISKLLSSQSSPSNQIITNCTVLACVMVGVQFDKKDIIRRSCGAALPQLMQSLLTRFQRVLWAWDGGNLEKDSTGYTLQAWNLLDIICRILELAQSHYNRSSDRDTMRNLDVCRKIYSRARSSEQNDPLISWAALRNTLHFTLTAAQVSRDPADLWDFSYSSLGTGDSHLPEEFDWLMDYYLDIYSDDQEVAFDILFLLGVMKVHCSPAKQHRFIERLITCMDSNMPVYLCYAALRATHIVQEEIASIDAIDAKLRDMVLTKLSPAILTTVCPQPGTTLANEDPYHFFHYARDSCYLKLIFALARNSTWYPHLFEDHHIDWCISMVGEYCESYSLHAFYLSGILLQIAPEQLLVASLDAITKRQWWDMTRMAWYHADRVIDDIYCFESLPVLVEGTKRYMHVASEEGLEELVRYVDDVLEALEKRDPEQGEGECVTVAVKELRTAASDMLDSEGVISP
ncbi:hypothetical protein F4604DRAFT_1933808 [Suillus subluteus]|nr:hypothetical protein F4604DRAFT_1933808 [Suillus subluteus]